MDMEELRLSIRNMTRKQAIYKVLKEELTALGYWRSLARGNPRAGKKGQERTLSQGLTDWRL